MFLVMGFIMKGYKDDAKNGLGVMYYINENKRLEGMYLNDKKEGFGIFFDNNNTIIEKGIFKENNLIQKI